jgi:serine protease Do
MQQKTNRTIRPVAAVLAAALFIVGSLPYLEAQSRAAESELSLVEAYQNTVRRVSQSVLPVVVEIDTVQRVSRQIREMPSPLEFFFGRPNSEPGSPEPQTREFEQRGIGSGIIVRRDDEKVYVLTNNHVAGSADDISISLYDGREFEGSLVGADPNKDLALIVFETDEEIPLHSLETRVRSRSGTSCWPSVIPSGSNRR